MADDDKYDVIPATQRPDGTWRKEIKVRKGYVPPDEAKKYEAKGTAYKKEKEAGFVPGMDPDEFNAPKQAPKSKNQRRNENRRKRKEEGGDEGVDEVAEGMGNVKVTEPAAAEAPAAPEDPKEALNKKIRNLKKKVRQSDELQQKVASGEVDPNAEQKEKLAKRGEFEVEIKKLEAELAAM